MSPWFMTEHDGGVRRESHAWSSSRVVRTKRDQFDDFGALAGGDEQGELRSARVRRACWNYTACTNSTVVNRDNAKAKKNKNK